MKRNNNKIEGDNGQQKPAPHPTGIIDIDKAQAYRREKRLEAMKASKRRERRDHDTPDGKRKSFITGKSLVYIAILAFIITIGMISGAKVISLQAEAREAKTTLNAVAAEKAQLEKEFAMANDPGYIEDQARDKLRMIMKGETLYVFSAQEEDNSQ